MWATRPRAFLPGFGTTTRSLHLPPLPASSCGVTIVEGHEYAETVTDQNPPGGWTNQTGSTYSGEENGDECAWIASGQGASANVAMGNGSYPMQSTWSNDTNRCDISHPAVH